MKRLGIGLLIVLFLGMSGTSTTTIFDSITVTGTLTCSGTLALDAELNALAGLTSAANKIPYFTGSGTAALISSSANMISLLASADYATARTNLGLAIGTNVQAYSAGLAAIAAMTTQTDSYIIVGDGATWVAETGATARTSLGVAIGTDVQAYDAQLASLAGLASVANLLDIANMGQTDSYILVGDGANWVSETGATARTSLGVAIGADVQAYSADLGTIATAAGTATNEGVLFCTTFKVDYTQTSSQTVGIIPANAYVTKVEVAVTTLFNGGGNDYLDIGYSGGAADAYAANLDLSAAGYITTGGVFSALGSVGGANRTITCIYEDQNADASAGSALVNIYWRAGTIGD